MEAAEVKGLIGFICAYRLSILVVVLLGLLYRSQNSFLNGLFMKRQIEELTLILLPFLLLVVTARCSIHSLYAYNNFLTKRLLCIKISGAQWYWHYELSGCNVEFDSFILPENELPLGGARFLEVDQRLIVPVETPMLLIFTSTDVIHSWSLPRHTIKVDCLAGILNSQPVVFNTVGIYYGQCSELCGVGHAFIPIMVEVRLYKF
jgi:heme/copper-type cytochrome/quinol oxidase subunit 2